jgi:hypothetical protein
LFETPDDASGPPENPGRRKGFRLLTKFIEPVPSKDSCITEDRAKLRISWEVKRSGEVKSEPRCDDRGRQARAFWLSVRVSWSIPLGIVSGSIFLDSAPLPGKLATA